ncbi:MAG: M56 family metallopeptidase [Frankiaceae bacterium]
MLLPPIAAMLLGLFGTRLGRRLPPATAVRLLSFAALCTALATGAVLAAAGVVVVGQVPLVARLGHWSGTAIRSGDPVPTLAGVLAGAALLWLLGSTLRRVVSTGRELTAAARICRHLGPAAEGLVIVDDEAPDAYALPGIRGRIVVSTAMLRALPGEERRVLLAHEAAHLAHRHHLYVQLAELAAAANPLLRPVSRAVRLAVERWADEVAATEVGNRRLAAQALARAGLARSQRRAGAAPAAALTAVDSGVAERARALLAGPPRPRPLLAAAVVAVVLATTAAAAETSHETASRFERAEALYVTAR